MLLQARILMRRAARTDKNQRAIVAALRNAGCSVLSLAAIGQGCPDLLVGHRRTNTLLEIKTAKGAANEKQRAWAQAWDGQCSIVRTPEEAILAVMGK